MIHGKTKIELYNPNTKIKKVFRDENVFQSEVLAKQLDTLGEFDLPNKYNYSDLVGGILLFRDAITVGSEFMPAGNKMVAQGYRGCTTQGEYSLLGTFNSSESSAGATAITQVYDYATNQANGTMGCVCLTSLKGGQIGYGIGSNTPYSLYNLSNYIGASIGEAGGQGGYYDGYRYYVSGYSNSVLSIQKTPVDVKKGNIFRGLSKTLTFDISEIGTPKYVEPYWNVMGDCGNGIFRFWSESIGTSPISVASGGTIYYYEFDATTETLSQKTLTNTSGETIKLANYGVQFRGDKCFIANFAQSQQGVNVYVFSVSDGMFLKKLTGCANFAYYDGTFGPRFLPCELSDDLFLMHGYSNGFYTFLYDAVADTTERMNLNINPSTGSSFACMTQMKSIGGGLKAVTRQFNSSYYGYVGRNPLYLATINNLQSPVTKTAAQTMKVTYTLTEA